MKHIYVVESSGGRKWRPRGLTYVTSLFTKADAEKRMKQEARLAPGLKWRVAKYVRVEVPE